MSEWYYPMMSIATATRIVIVAVPTAEWSFAANWTVFCITERQSAGATGGSSHASGNLLVPPDGSMTQKIFIRLVNPPMFLATRIIVGVSTAQWSFAANGTALFITARQPAGASGLSIPTNGILGVPADGSMTKDFYPVEKCEPCPSRVACDCDQPFSICEGYNNEVAIYGKQDNTAWQGRAVCRGNWWIKPCEWESYCSTGWRWSAEDFYPVP